MTSPPPSEVPMRGRLVSLDVFRGLTVAAMLLVNDPGNWNAVYAPLDHAEWHGWTPTDLVFPFFLFIVGITSHLSLASRRASGIDTTVLMRQILRRGATIFALGLLIAWFPGFSWQPIDGVADPTFLQRLGDHLLHWRIPGVLQRIGVAYVLGGMLTLWVSLRSQMAIALILLLGYWAVSMLVPAPGTGATGLAAIAQPDATLAAYLDRLLLDWGVWGNHLWGQSKTWDPEGLLSTFPSIATLLLGLVSGRWIGTSRPLAQRIAVLFAAGAICVVLGLAWDLWFPINKKLWTSSYVVFSAGMAGITLSACMWMVELRHSIWWTRPLLVFGVNPILAYVGSELMETLIYSTITFDYHGERVSLVDVIYRAVCLPLLPDRAASLLFAIAFVWFWYLILSQLYRRGIVLKV